MLASEEPRNILSNIFAARVIVDAFYSTSNGGAPKARRRQADM
jgi:hypothetical protein